jgi:hypothetical protein
MSGIPTRGRKIKTGARYFAARGRGESADPGSPRRIERLAAPVAETRDVTIYRLRSPRPGSDAYLRKSPTRSSPSSRQGGCLGFSPGNRAAFPRRSRFRRTQQQTAVTRGSTYSSFGARWCSMASPRKAGLPSARRSVLAAMCGRANGARPSSMLIVLSPTMNAAVPARQATNL